MAKQKFSNVDRRAVFEAYDCRCFFCNAPLTYRESELEHLIPEDLRGDDARLAQTLAKYALPASYDLRGDENIVLACSPCNSKKSNTLLYPNQMAIMLAAAERRVPRVKELRAKYGRIITADKLVLSLVAAIEKGATTTQEIDGLMWRYYGQSLIKLSYPLRFIGVPPATALSRADLEDLWDTPLRIWEEPGEGIHLVHDDGRSLEVVTCRQFAEAITEGFFAPTTASIKMSSLFEDALGVLYALEHAEPAKTSFIREPRVGLCDLRFLSSALVPFTNESPDNHLFGSPPAQTLQDLQDQGLLEVLTFSSLSLTFKFNGMITSLREILRADIDHDGIEEMLISSRNRADGGTLGFGYTAILARKAEDEIISPLDIRLPHHPPSPPALS